MIKQQSIQARWFMQKLWSQHKK